MRGWEGCGGSKSRAARLDFPEATCALPRLVNHPVSPREMHAYRTHTCGALRAADTGKTVRVSGWIHRKRDHGGLIFIDLRDHYGLTQLVLSPGTPGFATVEHLRAESVIRVDGEVVARTAETISNCLNCCGAWGSA